MPTVTLTIPGKAVPWQRTGGNGRHRFTPKRTRDYEALVSAIASAQWGPRGPLDCPVALEVTAYTRRPTSRARAKDSPLVVVPHWTKPDASNMLKAIEDGLQKGGVVVDDSRFWCVTMRKLWLPVGDLRERVEVVMTWRER